MKPGFQDGSITCNTGDGRFDLVEGIPIPTSQPTALPTNQPTLAPTPQPTSLPTLAVETLVVVKSGMSFTPSSGGAAEMDTPETRAAIAAQMEAAYLANGLLITIPLDSITFADTGGRRLGEPEETDAQGRRQLTGGVAVEFDLQVSLEMNYGTTTDALATSTAAVTVPTSAVEIGRASCRERV